MKKTILIIMLSLIIPVFIGCNGTTQTTNPNSELCTVSSDENVYLCEKTSASYFNTVISLKLYYTSEDTYDVSTVFDYFTSTAKTYHEYFDKYNEYDGINNVYTINNSDSPVILDNEFYQAIEFALSNQDLVIADDTRLFNIALNPVLKVWHNARENVNCEDREIGILYCPVPNDEIDGITFNTNPENIQLNDTDKSIEFLESDMSIDLGGFAKGYVANVITEYLNNLNITYLLNLGNSNVICNGQNPLNDSSDFIIALIEPSNDFKIVNTYYQYVQLPEDFALVTSGNYQRFFKDVENGDVYHHIIDPRTNYPGGEVMSVSVIYPDSAIADLLSTAIYLLDLEDALNKVNSTVNLEAVWYSYDGTVTYSDGFEEFDFNLT